MPMMLSKMASMQQELTQMSRLMQSTLNMVQSLVATKTPELPAGVHLPVKTLLELDGLEQKLKNKHTAEAVVRFK